MIRGAVGYTDTELSQPSHDQGGHDGAEPDEDSTGEQIRQAVAANQAENDQLIHPACCCTRTHLSKLSEKY